MWKTTSVSSFPTTNAGSPVLAAAPLSTNSCFGVAINFLMTSNPAEFCTLSGWVSPPPGGPIRPITERPSSSDILYPLPYQRPLRFAFPRGERRAYHVPLVSLRGIGPSSTPGALRLRQTTLDRLFLAPQYGRSSATPPHPSRRFGLVGRAAACTCSVRAFGRTPLRCLQRFTYVDPTTPPWLPGTGAGLLRPYFQTWRLCPQGFVQVRYQRCTPGWGTVGRTTGCITFSRYNSDTRLLVSHQRAVSRRLIFYQPLCKPLLDPSQPVSRNLTNGPQESLVCHHC